MMISNQTWLFLAMAAIGFTTGFMYDIFRIFRKTVKHLDILTHLEDLCFWLLASGLVFYFILNKNYGQIRIYLLIGVFLGMLIYFLTLSRLVIFMSVTIINFLKKVIATLFAIIMFPVKLVLKILSVPVKLVGKQVVKAKKPVKKVLQKSKSYAKIKSRKALKELGIIFKKV